jgi:hypothetical protein
MLFIAGYRASTIHQSRQFYGPSPSLGPAPQGNAPGPEGNAPGPEGNALYPVYTLLYNPFSAYSTSYQPPNQQGYTTQQGGNYGYVPGANYVPGSEPSSYSSYDQPQYNPRDPYKYSYSGTPQAQPGAAPRDGQPQYYPRDPYKYLYSGTPQAQPGAAPRDDQPQYNPKDPYGRGGATNPTTRTTQRREQPNSATNPTAQPSDACKITS